MHYVVRALLLTVVTLAIWLGLVRFSERSRFDTHGGDLAACRVAFVYDGDTVALNCGEGTEITARVVGMDAPETKKSGCAEELAHGTLATDRLREMLNRSDVTFHRTGTDKYNRPLIRLFTDGEDVARTMIREGLAVRYGGGKHINWCERLGAL